MDIHHLFIFILLCCTRCPTFLVQLLSSFTVAMIDVSVNHASNDNLSDELFFLFGTETKVFSSKTSSLIMLVSVRLSDLLFVFQKVSAFLIDNLAPNLLDILAKFARAIDNTNAKTL